MTQWTAGSDGGRRVEGAAPRSRSAGKLGLERYVIYLAVFLSPFPNLRTDFVFFTVSDALYCLAAVLLLLRGRLPRNPLGVATAPWIAAFVLIVGGLLLSSLFVGDPGRGLVLLLQYSFCFLLLPFILMYGEEREAYRLVLLFALGVFVLDLHGIITFYTVGYVPGAVTVTGGRRLATLVGDANAGACVTAMAIVIMLWLRTTKRVSLVVFLTLSATMFLALVLTSSNTGLIVTVIGIAVFTGLTFRASLLIKIVPIIALLAVFLQFGGIEYLPPTFQKRVLSAVVSGDISEAGTFASRSTLMVEALDLIGSRDVIFLGIGADQFRVLSVQEAPVHNAYLLLWSEGGVLSLGGWVLFCTLGFFLSVLAWRRGGGFGNSAAVLVCFVVFAAMSSANAHIYQRYWYTVLLLVMRPTIIALGRSISPTEQRMMMHVRRGSGPVLPG